MGITRDGKRARSEKALAEFIKANGEWNSEHWVYHKEPICAQDICVMDAVLLKSGEVVFTDYDRAQKSWPASFYRSSADLDYEYLDSALVQMGGTQANYTRKATAKKTGARKK